MVNSPLKTLCFITFLLAIAVTFATGGYMLFLGLYMIGISLILYLVNYIVAGNAKTKNKFWLTQFLISLVHILLVLWAIMKQGEHNPIYFPNNYKGQV
jgi:hypothetical protein